MTDRDDWTACVEAFVVRARRVELHSLAADRVALLELSQNTHTIQVDRATGQAWEVENLPPEEQVESAAARVRPFLLQREPIHHGKVMDAVSGLLARTSDGELASQVDRLRHHWSQINSRSKEIHAFGMQIQDAAGITHEPIPDNELAFGWIYGDTVHADTDRLVATRSYGVKNRYRAAVPLVARLFVLTIQTLNLIRAAVEQQQLHLDAGTFTQEVVVTDHTSRRPAQLYVSDVDPNSPYPRMEEPLDTRWSPWTPHPESRHQDGPSADPAT